MGKKKAVKEALEKLEYLKCNTNNFVDTLDSIANQLDNLKYNISNYEDKLSEVADTLDKKKKESNDSVDEDLDDLDDLDDLFGISSDNSFSTSGFGNSGMGSGFSSNKSFGDSFSTSGFGNSDSYNKPFSNNNTGRVEDKPKKKPNIHILSTLTLIGLGAYSVYKKFKK